MTPWKECSTSLPGDVRFRPVIYKELHAALLRNVDTYTVQDQFAKVFEKPLEKGLYKNLPNSPRGWTAPSPAILAVAGACWYVFLIGDVAPVKWRSKSLA